MKVEYRANNSGGGWWLSTKDWLALEKAGWFVEWGGSYFCKSRFSISEKPANKPEPCKVADKCPGHRRFDSLSEMTKKDYYLGAAAHNAHKSFPTIKSALEEFEKATGQNVSDEGCNCCGAPHSFSWKGGYASGEDALKYLYPTAPTNLSKRDLLEQSIKGKKK